MSHIVVFGATGYAGNAVLTEALLRGHHAKAVARRVETIAAGDHLAVVSGSIHDHEFVNDALTRADATFIALPAHEVDGRTLADALPGVLDRARETQIRVGVMGGAGSLLVREGGPALVDTPDFPDALKPEVAAHRKVLDVLEGSNGVDWFYVSPAAGYGPWAPGSKTGIYRTGGRILLTDESGNSGLSGADLGVAVIDEIERPTHHHERFAVGY